MPGRSKLLRRFGEESVIRVVAKLAVESGLDPVVVCVAGDSDAVSGALEGLPVRAIAVRGASRGPIATVAAGLSALRGTGASAALVLLGDEPGLRASDIDAVRKAWIAGAGDLLRARFTDRPGHPVLVAGSQFDNVIDLAASSDKEVGMWERLTLAGCAGVEVPVNREAPIDVDSPAALRAARSRNRR